MIENVLSEGEHISDESFDFLRFSHAINNWDFDHFDSVDVPGADDDLNVVLVCSFHDTFIKFKYCSNKQGVKLKGFWLFELINLSPYGIGRCEQFVCTDTLIEFFDSEIGKAWF